ncbi:hypothetical protein [Moorena sp. SIO4G3]|uniref:hypothetical protein n=1 Tax=Moorena sp. SIO4G3 TaxID=2607821 RepID=UPI001428E49D|nr:hypothetical protein [Moorena sp. SIO4G3]NEO75734.1 hypothetical protein [Moorena sp. SIO4G3]
MFSVKKLKGEVQMKSILKIFSSLLLTFTLFLGFTGAASASFTHCDLVNNYYCPSVNLDLYDAVLVDIPGNNEVVLDIAPFDIGNSYTMNYKLGGDLKAGEFIGNIHGSIPTDEPDNGFVQNISKNNPQIINVTLSKKY